MQVTASLVAKNQSSRLLVEALPLGLGLANLPSLDALPEHFHRRILFRIVGVSVRERRAKVVVRDGAMSLFGDCFLQGIHAVSRPDSTVRGTGDECPILGGKLNSVVALEGRDLLFRERG